MSAVEATPPYVCPISPATHTVTILTRDLDPSGIIIAACSPIYFIRQGRRKVRISRADIDIVIEKARDTFHRQGDATTALVLFGQALSWADQQQDAVLRGFILSRIGVLHAATGDFVQATHYLEQALGLRDRMDREDLLLTLRHLGTAFAKLGDSERALTCLQDAYMLLDTASDGVLVAQILSALGGVQFSIGDYDAAVRFHEQGLELYRNHQDRFGEMRLLGNLANLEVLRQNLERARVHITMMLAILPEIGRPYDTANALMIAASVHFESGDLDHALVHGTQVRTLAETHGFDELHVTSLDMLQGIFMKKGELGDAVAMGRKAVEVANRIGRKSREADARYRLSETLEKLGDYQEALSHTREYARLREEIAGAERQRAIAEMQGRFDLERALEEKRLLGIELQNQRGELATAALYGVEKRELLKTLLLRLRNIRSAGDGRELRNLVSELDARLQQEPEWKIFESQFAVIHAEFLPLLIARYPDLSPAEVKICTLTRLNLDTKQIATLLNVDPRTIQNHRGNIRKKLGISGRESLLGFLSGIRGTV